jgi:[acyl-carrier-protein] S-malonyltransferase
VQAETVLVITAPGQGAQAPGFLTPWLDVPGVAERLGAWSELAGCDLIRYGSTAGADEIRDTAVAQPLLVAAGLAAASALFGGTGPAPEPAGSGKPAAGTAAGGPALAAAGHSVGELTAGAIAGALSAGDALRLVAVRGRAMAAAAAARPTGMTAVLGGDEAAVLAAIQAHGLTPANVNGAGQIVAAGTLEQLAAFAADPPAGARLRPLSVAGAFHTSHMAPAVSALRAAAGGIRVSDPVIALLSNRDGAVVSSGADWLDRIVGQVAAPVRWDECMRTMARAGVTALIELPPAGTLAGLARRALPGVAVLALKTPDDLDAARKLLADHAAGDPGRQSGPAGAGPAAGSPHPAAGTAVPAAGAAAPAADAPGEDGDGDAAAASAGDLPEWRLLVAPLGGTFRSAPPGAPDGAGSTARGHTVGTSTEVGHVEARSDRRAIIPQWRGAIIEWLVQDGDPVSFGQPLARLLPEGAE